MLETLLEDPFVGAPWLHKLHNGLFATDLDGTETSGAEHPSAKELEDRAWVHRVAQEKGLVEGAITFRTLALTMSSTMYRASCRLGFGEPRPRCRKRPDGTYGYIPLETVPFFEGNLDYDLSAGVGSGIAVRHEHAYKVDWAYHEILQHD